MTEKKADRDKVIVSPSLLCWDPSKYVYYPAFDLGIGEEWLPKHPLASDDDDEFWENVAMNEEASITTTLSTQVSNISSYVHLHL